MNQKLTFVLYEKYFILKLDTAEIEILISFQTVEMTRMNNNSVIRKKTNNNKVIRKRNQV